MNALLTGTFASAISLYGIALIYGATGHFDYPGIRAAIDGDSTLALGGIVLLLVGVLTRQGLAPFHHWVTNLTEAAPAAVAICIPAIVATAGAFALMRIVDAIVPGALPGFSMLFGVIAAVSMLVGSLMALVQSNLKRMLAYGGVAHAGFFLAAISVPTPEARAAALFQLTVFLFMQVGALGVVTALAKRGREWDALSDYTGIAESRPILAAAMTIFMLALAGLPGTSGFVSRLFVMSSVIGGDRMPIALVMTITSVVLFAAYLRVPTAMYLRPGSGGEASDLSISAVLALAICVLATLYFGLFPGPGPIPFEILEIVQRAVQP